MDVLTISALSTGIVAVVVAILTHLKHSECCRGMFECDTRGRNSTPSTPNEIKHDIESCI
jgi:hypothetical protein